MLANWAKQTVSSGGTGNLTLGAASAGHVTLDTAMGQGPRFLYKIEDGNNRESGVGYLSASTTLVRETVHETLVSGTYTRQGATAINVTTSAVVTIAADAGAMSYFHVPQGSIGERIVVPEGLQLSAAADNILGANTPYATNLYWPGGNISNLVCHVITGSGTGSDRLQLGIYAPSASGAPGALLVRTTDIDPSTTGRKTQPLSIGANYRLPPGYYWFVSMSNVTPRVSGYNAGGAAALLANTSMGGPGGGDWQRRYCYFTCTAVGAGWTALPASITLAAGVQIQTNFAPIVAATVVP